MLKRPSKCRFQKPSAAGTHPVGERRTGASANPAGVKNGSRLRLKGKGNLQPGTGRRGDLYLNLEVQPHDVWRLDGDQLRADLPVSLDELALGGTVTVMTPDGEADVSIPAGTPPGRSLRLKGKGWPGRNGRGDLLLTLSLQWPEAWSEREKDLLTQLQQNRSSDPRRSWLPVGPSLTHPLTISGSRQCPLDGAHLPPSPPAPDSCPAGHGA